jgi:hypothetical protein
MPDDAPHRIIRAGTYAGLDARHRWQNLGPRPPADAPPASHVVCRRVADYAPQTPPAAAAFTVCHTCAAPIAYNPAGRHPELPKVCMQCAGIEPLPMETPQ